MNTEETRWKSNDGLDLYACAWTPDGDARAVVALVHGLGEHCGRYAHVAAHLNQAGYAVLAFDQRGHGKSAGKRGYIPSYDALMDDVALLLSQAAARFPGKALYLYGHSLGGSMVINYALRRQPKLAGVIATSPGLRTAFAPPPLKLLLGKAAYSIYPGLILPNGLEVAAISRDPAVVAAYHSDPLGHDRLSARLGIDLLASGEWALANAERLNLPLLLLHGEADRLTSSAASAEFASKAGARCTFKTWPGGYHELHNDIEKADVLAYIVAWLDRQQAAGLVL